MLVVQKCVMRHCLFMSNIPIKGEKKLHNRVWTKTWTLELINSAKVQTAKLSNQAIALPLTTATNLTELRERNRARGRGVERQGGSVAQSGDDSLKDTSDSNWGRDWVQVSVTGTGRGGRRVQQAVMVSGTWAPAGTGVSFSSKFPRRSRVCGPVILFLFLIYVFYLFFAFWNVPFEHVFAYTTHVHLTWMFDAGGALRWYSTSAGRMSRILYETGHKCS